MWSFLISLLIISVVFVFFYFDVKRHQCGLSLGGLLAFFGILYSLSPYWSGLVDSSEFNYLLVLNACSFIVLLFFYSIFSTFNFSGGYIIGNEEKKLMYVFLVSIFILSLFIGIMLIIKLGGLDFFFMSRAARGVALGKFTNLMFFKSLFSLVFIVSLIFYFETNSKKFLNLSIIALVVGSSYAIATISRGSLVQYAFPLMFILCHYKKLRAKIAIIMLGLGLIIGVIWKPILAIVFLDSKFSTSVFERLYPAEFYEWFKITALIINEPLRYGSSYLDGIISFIFPFYDVEPLSIWYINEFEPIIAGFGGGRGFTSFGEAIINFGLLGPLLIYGIYGMLYGIAFARRNLSWIDLYIVCSLLPFIHKLFRSEFIAMTKTWFWFFIVPIIAFYIINKMKRI